MLLFLFLQAPHTDTPSLFGEIIPQLSGVMPRRFPAIPRKMFSSIPGLKAHALAFVTPQVFYEYLKVYRIYRRDERFEMPFMSLTMGVSGNLMAARSLIRRPLLACRIRIHIVPEHSEWVFEKVFDVIRGFPNIRELEFVTHRYVVNKDYLFSYGSAGIDKWLSQCPSLEKVTVRFVDAGLVELKKREFDGAWMGGWAADEAKARVKALPFLEARKFANAVKVMEIRDRMEAKKLDDALKMLEVLHLGGDVSFLS